jgi:hypothetical protein
MNRISAVAATLTTAATLTAAVAATVAPAQASVPPAGPGSAAHVRTISRLTTAAKRARVTAQAAARAAANPSVSIGSETSGGKYVTVVHCSGGATPPPLKVGQPGTPLTASGTGPSAGLLAMLSKPNPYKTVYTCTVTVEEKTTAVAGPQEKSAHRACELSGSSGASGSSSAKVCHKGVTLNTGFGGMAKQVAGHHPGH